MRITKYSVEKEFNGKNILVKENSKNYPETNNLNSPQKIVKMMNDIYNVTTKAEEYLWLIALDTKCKPIGLFEVSHGTVSSSVVSPREIFVRLCLCGASYFIMVHNHPSGDVSPSKDDMETTNRLRKAGELMNIKLLDHVIIGDGYYSFSENV